MPEWTRGEFTISTEPSRIDMDRAAEFLRRSYWAETRPRPVIESAFRQSQPFGLFRGGEMVGMARAVTDFSTFAWLCDVFIDESVRGEGLGKWLVETILAWDRFLPETRWLLATADAQGLYEQCGFRGLSAPDRWMAIGFHATCESLEPR
jgi:GNAT superfamily N-acetyltransferase